MRKLAIEYIENAALARAEADLEQVKKEIDHYVHVDTMNQEHINWWLKTHEEDPEYLTKRTDKQVDIEMAITDLKNLIWMERR